MYRSKLRVKTGCERCKLRRKKCDEQRPQCGFCRKNGLRCTFGRSERPLENQISSSSLGPPAPRTERTTSAQGPVSPVDQTLFWTRQLQLNIRGMSTMRLDEFHVLPIVDAPGRAETSAKLWRMFTSMVDSAMPFAISIPQREIVRGWLESIFTDSAVCCAFLSYAARFEAQRSRSEASKLFSVEFETRALRAMQEKLDTGFLEDDNLILAASLHITSFSLWYQSPKYLSNLMSGIKLLVDRRKCTGHISQYLPTCVLLSLTVADTLVARMTGATPIMVEHVKPTSTRLFTNQLDASVEPSMMDCDEEVYEVFVEVKLALKFRRPCIASANTLSRSEEWDLYHLIFGIHIKLTALRSKDWTGGGVSAIVLHTLDLIELEVFADDVQHLTAVSGVLGRLQHAMSHFLQTRISDETAQDLVLWSCVVAMGNSEISGARLYFDTLFDQFQASTETVQESCRRFAWHSRLETALQYHICRKKVL